MRWTGEKWDAFATDEPNYEFLVSAVPIDTPSVESLVGKEIIDKMRTPKLSHENTIHD